jgi:hypothetical protein
VVDDCQWLDHASAQALAFAARRIQAEGVLLAFAAREPGQDFDGIPGFMVGGLRDLDARALQRSVVPWPLDEQVRERILAETRGNPLALLELPRGRSPAELAGGFGLPHELPLAGRIQESFLRRVEELPAATWLMVLLAAAEPAGDAARPAAHVAMALWDDESYDVLSARHIEIGREAGALAVLPTALTTRIVACAFAGQLAAAEELIEEMRALTAAMRIPAPAYGPVFVSAWRGREEAALAVIDGAVREFTVSGEGAVLAFADYARPRPPTPSKTRESPSSRKGSPSSSRRRPAPERPSVPRTPWRAWWR